MRKFIISWKENNSSPRTNKITLSNPTGDIGKDAKAALNILTSNFKSLKYIEIIDIQEIDKDGAPIGEPIKPMEDTSIVPTGK